MLPKKAEISFKDWVDDASARGNRTTTYNFILTFNGTEISGSKDIANSIGNSASDTFDINPIMNKLRNEIVLPKLEKAFANNTLPEVTEEEVDKYVYNRVLDVGSSLPLMINDPLKQVAINPQDKK